MFLKNKDNVFTDEKLLFQQQNCAVYADFFLIAYKTQQKFESTSTFRICC